MNTLTPTPRALIESLCADLRVDWTGRNRCTVYSRTVEGGSDLSMKLCDSGQVDRGVEGHEYIRAFGLMQHVYALKIGTVKLRIVSPTFSPSGRFSNLSALERVVSV